MPPNTDVATKKSVPMLDLGEPSAEVLEYARVEIGETPDIRACTLQELRDMIYERGDIVPHRMDDAFLLRFLRARYFKVEKAHNLMVRYYNFKDENPGIQEGVEYLGTSLQYISNEHIISVLPYRDQNGRRTMIYRIGNWNTSICGVDDLFRATLLLLELAIMEQRAQILGGVCFFDLENLSMQQAWYVTPSVANTVIQLMGSSFPIRIHSIHILNQPWVFDMVFAMFKPLLDERMRARIHFHGSNFETLHQHVDPKHLPERYGGTREEERNSEWIESLDTNQEIVDEMTGLGYICELRVVKTEGEKESSKNLEETEDGAAVAQN